MFKKTPILKQIESRVQLCTFFCHQQWNCTSTIALKNVKHLIRGRPQRTSAIFRGGGGTQLQTFADMRGGGVSGMQTSAFFWNNHYTFPIKTSKFLAICASKKKYIYHRYKVAWNATTFFIDFHQKLKQKALIFFLLSMHGSNQVDLNWVVKNFVSKPFMKWVLTTKWSVQHLPVCKYRKSQTGEDHKRID